MRYLIPEAARAWRMLTMHIAAAAVVFGLLPPDQQQAILAAVGVAPERFPLALGLAVMIARLWHQPSVRGEK